jgi:hypothetical protein
VWAQKKTSAKERKAPLFIPNELYGEVSEYEKIREENIKVSSPLPPTPPPVTIVAYLYHN